MRSYQEISDAAWNAAQVAAMEWLSGHPGHGVPEEVVRDIRALVARDGVRAASRGGKHASFAAILDFARALSAELLDSWDDGSDCAALPVKPLGGCPGGGATPRLPDFDLEELKRAATAAAAWSLRDIPNPREAAESAACDALVAALSTYDGSRASLRTWVSVSARWHARRERGRLKQLAAREIAGVDDSAYQTGSRYRTQPADPSLIKLVDRLAAAELSPAEYDAYRLFRLGMPAGPQSQRDGLRRATAKLSRRLGELGYGPNDFFLET